MSEQNDYEDHLKIMVEEQLVPRGIDNENVLKAMLKVPRHIFVPLKYLAYAYQDRPLPIDEGQTISQPYIVAKMIQALKPENDDRVLEVGTGSGYAAAVISLISKQVYTIERHQLLAVQAQERYKKLYYDNIEVKIDDGTNGWKEKAPFDKILVSAGAPALPEPLTNQLKVDGVMIIPVGKDKKIQELIRLTKTSEQKYKIEELESVRFVPLVGEKGWTP